jgi:uncharacterized membrane protein
MLRWFLYPVGDDNYLVVAAAAIALLLLLGLGPAREKTTKRRRGVLLGIRLAVIVMVILAMLRPTLVIVETRKQSATLVVLADKSRSMTIRDEVNGRTRWEALRDTLANARGGFRALGEEMEVKAYAFDAEPHPASVADGRIEVGDTSDGAQTAIGYVLDDVLRQEAGKRLLGVLLLSDGAQRTAPPRDVLPQTAATRLKHLGEPLYTIRFGQSRGLGQVQDVAVTELAADSTVFVKNELAITAQVRIDGYINRPIPVALLVEDASGKTDTAAQQTVKATANGERIPLKFSYVPDTPGEYKLTLKLDAQEGELVTTNNRLSTFVHVLKGGIKVLYVEGFPGRAERRFLIESLAASPDVGVDGLVLNAAAPESRLANLGERFKPGKYDVYMLGNVDATAFRKEELADLAATVSKGAGLIMLGGLQSFGPGGYAETPLADVLPVTMDRLERQRPDGPAPKDLHLSGPVRIRPTPRGLSSFCLRLAPTPNESASLWNQLPPLTEGANKFSGLKRGAIILATSQQDQPLLVSHTVGDGRVLAFAGDSTWHWWLRGFETAHKRFWRQIILWLAKKDEATEGNVWIKLSQRRFTPGQRVEFTVGAQAASGESVSSASFQAEIESPSGQKSPLSLVRGDESTSGSYRDTQQVGDYAIRVTATQDGRELGATKARFLVIEQDLELDSPMADATLMDNLATMTGGKALVPEELPDLLRQLAQDTQALEVQTEAKKTFWDTWPFFLGLVGLLATEWFLRKRWGLV